MPKFPEFLQVRAPAGTAEALDALARSEGRRPAEIVREALAERLTRLRISDEAARAA